MPEKRTKLVTQTLKLIRQEIEFLNVEEKTINEILNDENILEKGREKLKKLSQIEKRIKKINQIIIVRLDSLTNTKTTKILLVDASKMLQIRGYLTILMSKIDKKARIGFLGKIKGEIARDIKKNNEKRMTKDLFYMKKTIIALRDVLVQTRNEFSQIEDKLESKIALSEDRLATQNNTQNNTNYEIYYHATDNPQFFKLNPIQLKRKDFFFAKEIRDAVEHQMGFSGADRASIKLIQIKIPSNLARKFIKPYTTDSFTDAETECYMIPVRYINEVNRLIKSNKIILILIK